MMRTESEKRQLDRKQYERMLLDLCETIGGIAEMNGPATASFSGWIALAADNRDLADLTLREFLHHLETWKEWQRRLYEDAVAIQKTETGGAS